LAFRLVSGDFARLRVSGQDNLPFGSTLIESEILLIIGNMLNEEHLILDPFPNSVKLGEKWKSGGNCGDDIYLLG
jgi:hypothetical protein